MPSQTTIYLRERGGRYGDIATWGFGAPEFQAGERVLVFLKLRADGFFQTDHMFQGKFRAADSGRLEALLPGGIRLLEEQTPRFESLDQVERSALRQPRRRLSRWVERLQLTAPEVLSRFSFEGVGDIAAPRTGGRGAQYYTLSAGGIRWRAFDTGGSVSFRVNLTGAPLPGATTTSAINASLQAWNNVAATRISLVNGGATALRGVNNSDNINVISFGDPDNDVPDLSGCSGTLAIAYVSYYLANHTVSGISFGELLDADIVFNNGIECSMTVASSLEEVCGHEVGHTIGLGHSSENPSEPNSVLLDALMYYRARRDGRGASVRADDISGVQVIYPDGSVVCNYSISPTSRSHGSGAESSTVSVTTTAGCAWTAASNASWISITSGSSGTGSGTVGYSVSANATGSSRSGSVTIAGQTFSVTQATATCTYLISPTSRSHGAGAESSTVSVTAASGCNWTASSNASWITITSGSSGTGNGTVGYSVAANSTSSQRTGSATIAGQVFSVTQAAGTCTYLISPTTRSHGGGVENSTAAVTTASGCSWTASSNNSWITITSGSSGTGNGTVGYTVAANTTGFSRSGSATIAGQIFAVTQAPAAACTYLISPTTRSHGGGAESSTVAVTTASGCSWTASSNDSWITITSGGSGTANGTVGYTVAANATGFSRSGSATIAGQIFGVTQAPLTTCSYLLSPTTRSHGSGAESATVAVTAASGCSWGASSNASWITITSGGSGTGNGAVGYTVAANSTGSQRSGSATIAGQIFGVTQAAGAAPCTYSISPTSRSHGAAAENSTVAVSTASACSWTASSNASWITITSGSSGTWNGTVGYTVAANSTGTARTGSLTIAGQTFSVTQSAAAACTYVISPTTRSHGSGADNSTVAVTTASGCSWTASSNAPWITITSGGSGTANGTVGYAVAANSTGTQRSGSATIASQTFSVTQAVAACSYSIAPTSRSHAAGAESGTIAVTTASGCSWTAVSNAAWVAIASGSNGTGNGTVSYSTQANSASGPRTGTLTIAGQTFTLTQSGKAELGVLFPTTSRFNPQLQPLNDSLQTSMALLLPPVGIVDPLAPPVEALQFRARNVDGSQQQDSAGSIYWGQQLGVHADDLLNLPNLRNVTVPSALDALAGAANIKGFFLIHSSDYGNMDGVSSDFRVGKKLVLAGLRYRRANIGSAVTRQTHVFLDNPGAAAATVSVRLIVPFPAGDQYEIATLNLPAKASVFSSLDKLFVSLSGGGPGFDLPSGSHLVVEASAELRGMLVFENGKSSIAAAKAIIPELSAAEKLATSRRLYAPFVTVSRSSGSSEEDRFDSALTLYNGDATDEATVTVRAFGPSGLPMFPSGASVKLTVRAGGQVTLPVLRRDGGPGLFFDEPSIPGPDLRNGYLEIVINKDVSAFGTRGSLNVHGFTSVKFAGANETIIPLTASGLEQANFLHVAHNPGQGPFRTALAILNPEDADTTVKIEIFEANNAATAGDRARLGQPSYVGRISLAGHQQTIKFVDQLINEAQAISGQPKPALTTQLGGYIRLTSENPAVKPMTFATYFSVEGSSLFIVNALASIDPG
ncbi:MAG: BACON domain-containing protein [Acidobacteriota bacterium]